MADKETLIRVSLDATGVESGVQRAQRSMEAFIASQEAAAQRTLIAQAAIAEANENGSKASERAINSLVQQAAKMADTYGMNSRQLLAYKASLLGVSDAIAPYIEKMNAIDAANGLAAGSTATVGESAEAAAARISAMVAASLESAAAITSSTEAADRYAASVDAMAAAATAAERANAGIAVSADAAATAQTSVAAQFEVASTVISEGAAKVTEALGRQLTALTASAAEMAVYDAQMAGFTEAETAQVAAIAKEIELRKQQIALGEEMAAMYAVDTAAAHGASGATSGVTAELMVLGREASNGNYTKLAGSFTRFLSLAGALDLLLNPISLSVVAIGGAMLYVAQQNGKMNEALALTGDYAGVTADQLRNMATAATAGGATFSTAATAVTELAATGRLTGDEIANLGRTAADAATYTSVSVKQMVDDFTKLAEDPVKASVKLNDQYHYLTVSTYDQIAALEKQGDATGAAQVAVEAFSAAMDERTKEISKNEGIILAGWRDIKSMINGALEAVGQFGAAAGPGEVVARMQANKAARSPINQWGPEDEADLQKAIATREKAEKDARDKARQDRQQQELIDGKHAYDTWNAQFATPAEKRAREIQKYIDTIATPLGLSWEQQLADEQKINDKDKDHKGKSPKTNENGINADLAALANQQKIIEDAVRSSLDHIKALRAEGVISEQDALTQSYVAEQSALQKRIEIDRQQEVIAEGKKNTEAYRKYADDIQRLQQQMTANYQKFGDDIGKMSAKEATAVAVYADSLEQQLQTQQAAASMKLTGLSMGSNTKADYDAQIKLMEDYDKKVAALSKSLSENKIGQDQYNAELKATQAYYDSSIQIARQSSADILAANEDWTTGASRAIQNYADSANNVAAQVDSSFTNMAKSMEDSIANFVTTGKLSFTSLANSIIADIVRMQARAAISGLFNMVAGMIGGGIANSFGTLATTSTAASAASGVMGSSYSSSLMGPSAVMPSFASLPARASGGPVAGGSTYLVGEKGPELFTPGSSGSIVPNHALGSSSSGGDINITVPVTMDGGSDPAANQQNSAELGKKIRRAVQSLLQDERRQGGVLWKIQNGVA
ncbi:phage tail tape measure protein [Paraburkholderia sp. SIMBA_030]|uniref:phage tail tape measure protein n=1 Tax=Paraburkholderia sp. SIMBA_030 TaxID=3085773 RepID=UPI00397D99FF